MHGTKTQRKKLLHYDVNVSGIPTENDLALTRVDDGESKGQNGIRGPTEGGPVRPTQRTSIGTDMADDGMLVVEILEEQKLGSGAIGGTLDYSTGEDLLLPKDSTIISRNEDAGAVNLIYPMHSG